MKNELCWYKEVCTQECNNSCIRFLEMDYLVQNSGIPVIHRYPKPLQPDNYDYDSFCRLEEIKENIVEFVNTGQHLYIASKYTGNGKTSWSTKLMLRYFDEIWAGNGFRVRGLFLHIPTLLAEFKNFNNPLPQEYKDLIMNTDLVIWDDIASMDMSNYDLTQLLIYLEARIMNGKACIYTGNIETLPELQKMVGIRLSSRIMNNSEVIIFKGKDRRAYK